MEDNLFSSLPGLPPAKGAGDPVLPVPYDPAPAPAAARPRAGSGAAPQRVSPTRHGWLAGSPARALDPGTRAPQPRGALPGVPGGPDCRPPPPPHGGGGPGVQAVVASQPAWSSRADVGTNQPREDERRWEAGSPTLGETPSPSLPAAVVGFLFAIFVFRGSSFATSAA